MQCILSLLKRTKHISEEQAKRMNQESVSGWHESVQKSVAAKVEPIEHVTHVKKYKFKPVMGSYLMSDPSQ